MPTTTSKQTLEYRGDDRHPIENYIFDTGFIPRDVSKPEYNEDKLPNNVSRTCFTHELSVASLFPLGKYSNVFEKS
jgi:hypothetical protein